MIKTFGSDVGHLQTQDLVQLAVKGTETNEIIHVNAFTMPIICSPLKGQAIKFAAGVNNTRENCILNLHDGVQQKLCFLSFLDTFSFCCCSRSIK